MDRSRVSPLVRRVIEVAAKKLGLAEVARRSSVSEPLLVAWRDGQATIPHAEFLRLVDLLVEIDAGWDDWDQASLTSSRVALPGTQADPCEEPTQATTVKPTDGVA